VPTMVPVVTWAWSGGAAKDPSAVVSSRAGIHGFVIAVLLCVKRDADKDDRPYAPEPVTTRDRSQGRA
jgi:hypothetical protein